MIFPDNPLDQDTFVFLNQVYTYWQQGHTWYAAGSNPNSVDPQIYQRRTDFQNYYDIVATYDDFQNIDNFTSLKNKIEFYQTEINKLILAFRNLPQEQQNSMIDREQQLLDLLAQIQGYINHPNPDSIIWPVFPL